MFPIRDHNPSGRTPFVTYGLIAANVLIFFGYYGLFADPAALGAFFSTWALVPAEVSSGGGLTGFVTSMFLHGGIMHLSGNMLFLFIFGDNVEDEMGHAAYAGFYLASGLGAGLAQYVTAPLSPVPMVGASGAIAGVMGAYLLLFPKARVDILVILVIIFRMITIPAWIMLALWLGMQFLGGFNSAADGGGTAYWAHAGGFVIGLVLALPLWLKRGGPAFWQRTRGAPPHPEARYQFRRTNVPRAGRSARRSRRAGPWGR
ncbi:rhomboid family intramembrane serine protease [Roseivivax sp. GX 12232]|uniref:rhomboid family intramembrane serine protease n=1 Tax=Roseivivax sp. GX 12232 TaxID=2900547 RepID=UPI001E459860|nr:rhomboid family intramembrane serine protease [Roseivivax sp. GX 12232]MCE0506981.1 rhomboid family intramembrane serine protease [Roseivivax sp. GX 12232]